MQTGKIHLGFIGDDIFQVYECEFELSFVYTRPAVDWRPIKSVPHHLPS